MFGSKGGDIGNEQRIIISEIFMEDFHERGQVILEELRDILTIQVDV